ncbi:MAG: hypothetical protein KatS3mg059_1027 [Thermomicrobiales bacterium]|nr:MAG: hypothetical protein KatS3mg059_1027 [Thermomicrobiales bacterium]
MTERTRGIPSRPAAGPSANPLPAGALGALEQDAIRAGGPWEGRPDEEEGWVGRTMFDGPKSEDGSVTVLLPREHIHRLPSQSLVRITSYPDLREYLGIVVSGPFAEPDGIRADAPLVVTTTVRGGIFMPRYHGRVQVEIMGERVDGALSPPRYRPLPNSPVYLLDEDETAAALGVDGDIRLGLAVGHEQVIVGIPSDRKSVLPRHTGIIGTTGGGKSTTVAGLIAQAQAAGAATVVLDIEGEYTFLHQPADNDAMQRLLAQRGLQARGVSDLTIYHLVGRESSNPRYAGRRAFSLEFSRLSPYTVAEILDLTEPQQMRYFQAYDLAKTMLRKAGQSRVDDLALDEFESGYPGMTLTHLVDAAQVLAAQVSKSQPVVTTSLFRDRLEEAQDAAKLMKPDHQVSWRALLGKLGALSRLRVFDNPSARALVYRELLTPGQVSIIDLSDTDSPDVNNLVITDILRGIQRAQEELYAQAEAESGAVPRTLVIIEEAHEFLSRERISRMPHLFAQVARIAKRGRKRWLGLVFVTQLPGHLPDELFGLINNWIVHKISDASVISLLRRSISGIDEGLWNRLPTLAPGQAIVSFTHMSRPVLTSIDPAPAKLRMVE